MTKVLIFGGSGFIGKTLSFHLQKAGYSPTIISRNNPDIGIPFVQWDGVNESNWCKELKDAEIIINLAGRTVNCIKTPDNCDVILRSRINATKIIGEALKNNPNKVKTWVQMSTAHIYGDPPSLPIIEDSALGYGLAPFVGKAWEETFHQYKSEGIRGVILRTSFVIGKKGGALAPLLLLARLGLGGKVASGKQGMSWIHEYDMNNIFLEAIENDNYQGVYIATAPDPLSNKDFMRCIRKAVKMPIGIPTPTFLVKFGAHYIMKTDPELGIYGRYLHPKRLEDSGFEFTFPTLNEALEDLV